MSYLIKHVLRLSPELATFARRGFQSCELSQQQHLERIGETFVFGFNAALDQVDVTGLLDALETIPVNMRGFAHEGAAMAWFLTDALSPFSVKRFPQLLTGPADNYRHLAFVGAGWAMARLPLMFRRHLNQLDPLLHWLSFDGYGFHAGYFHPRKCIEHQNVPRRISGYGRRAFDQGLGRSLWFVLGADPIRISTTIRTFDICRRDDLWSGVGLAAAYAGGVSKQALELLSRQSEQHHRTLVQGACFAAKARQRGGNPDSCTELACQVFSGLDWRTCASVTDEALQDLPAQENLPKYEHWRQQICSIALNEMAA